MANATVARPVEFPNMCAMSLALGKEVKTDSSISAQIEGMTYCFSNKDAKATFMKDPQGNLAKARAYKRAA
jgi:YHS domain-containing protein